MSVFVQPGMGILAGKISRRQGTAGIIVQYKGVVDSPRFLTTAWHVLNPKRRPSVEVTLEDGQRIGIHQRSLFKKLRGIDMAFILLDDQVIAENRPKGTDITLKHADSPEVGDQINKVGAVSGSTKGEIIEIDNAIAMEKFAIKINAINEPALPGDSGSIWFNSLTGSVVASHVRRAVANDDKIYVGSDLSIVLDLFGLELT